MDSVVREYRKSDRAAVLGLVERFTSFELPAWRDKDTIDAANSSALQAALDSPDPDHAVLVTEHDGVFAGFVHVRVTHDHFSRERICYISDIAVHPDCEGRGCAGRLLDAAIAWAHEHRLETITLEVFEGNERAKALYERHGFARDVVQYSRRTGEVATN